MLVTGGIIHMPWGTQRCQRAKPQVSVLASYLAGHSTVRAFHKLAGPPASWGSPPVSTFHLALEVLGL